MVQSEFRPGFRFSPRDAVILLVGSAATGLASSAVWWLGLIIALVTANFFLFCNVFRIARWLELLWSANFILLIGSTVLLDLPSWPITIGVSVAATAMVILMDMRQPSYHGVGWQRINPQLPQWFAQRRGGPAAALQQ